MYDFCIIGAGPSGATLARLLSKEFSVLLLDKRNLDKRSGSFHYRKCCGGLLAPDAQAMLARLELGLPSSILADPQLFVVRTIDLATGKEQLYQRHYINFDRELFDRWLVSLVPISVECRFGVVVKNIAEEKESVTVNYSRNGVGDYARARWCIGADGARSGARRMTGIKSPGIREYIAIQKTYQLRESQSHFSALFDSSITDFYGWTIPKNNYLHVGAALAPGGEANRKFDAMVKKLVTMGFPLGTEVNVSGAWINRPVKNSQVYAGTNRIILTGEAAGLISPSSAEGLSYAFKSAEMLASAVNRQGEQWVRRYKKSIKNLKKSILLKNLKSTVMYTPFARNIVLSSGLMSLDSTH
jgi:geranylgeranyl reductase